MNTKIDEFAYIHEKNVIDALKVYSDMPEYNPVPPRTIWIEITMNCTLKCKFCAHKSITRTAGEMTLENFKKIIDDINVMLEKFGDREMTEIALTRWGEPLLHKDIGKMIEYLTKNGLYSYLPTNGTVLTEERRNMIFSSSLKKMNISIDVMDDDKHKEIMGIPIKRRMINILSLLKEKYLKNLELPVIEVSMVKLADNEKDRDIFRKFFNLLSIDRANEGDCLSLMGKIGLEFDAEKKNKPCFAPWFTLGIYWNGDCTSCLPDPDGDTFIGNCYENKISEIWNGEKIRHFRKCIKDLDYKNFSQCLKCNVNTYDRYQIKPFFEAYINYTQRFKTLKPEEINFDEYLYLTHLQSIKSGAMNADRKKRSIELIDEVINRLGNGERFIDIVNEMLN